MNIIFFFFLHISLIFKVLLAISKLGVIICLASRVQEEENPCSCLMLKNMNTYQSDERGEKTGGEIKRTVSLDFCRLAFTFFHERSSMLLMSQDSSCLQLTDNWQLPHHFHPKLRIKV